ncbi:uncharacterized protein BT62DRAFT_1011994 [Guyanagaster necrorhizus]|uniref:Uncharacterized protein n=1 Tax=Guyanagaster necrorhizus TaxID=856835 RepID=A0A9P7VIW5_9AGAR|nr:uncharacterized protein BT62DRAFT_1011994 [Guyanagaster necrorhizus MCA 3950]KAG7441180.1 hypothetical protein BT62DRAFT_1011994 [Guyanagaster necrorhizus MCA 3950]
MTSVGPYHSSHPHIRSTVQIQHLTEKSDQPTCNAYHALLVRMWTSNDQYDPPRSMHPH